MDYACRRRQSWQIRLALNARHEARLLMANLQIANCQMLLCRLARLAQSQYCQLQAVARAGFGKDALQVALDRVLAD